MINPNDPVPAYIFTPRTIDPRQPHPTNEQYSFVAQYQDAVGDLKGNMHMDDVIELLAYREGELKAKHKQDLVEAVARAIAAERDRDYDPNKTSLAEIFVEAFLGSKS